MRMRIFSRAHKLTGVCLCVNVQAVVAMVKERLSAVEADLNVVDKPKTSVVSGMFKSLRAGFLGVS